MTPPVYLASESQEELQGPEDPRAEENHPSDWRDLPWCVLWWPAGFQSWPLVQFPAVHAGASGHIRIQIWKDGLVPTVATGGGGAGGQEKEAEETDCLWGTWELYAGKTFMKTIQVRYFMTIVHVK